MVPGTADTEARHVPVFRFLALTYARDLEAHFLEEKPDFPRLVALHFDGAFPHGASGSEGVTQVAREVFQFAPRERRGKIVDHDDGLATAAGRIAAQDDPSQPLRRLRLDRTRRGRPWRQRAEIQSGERIAEAGETALRRIDFDALWLFRTHGVKNAAVFATVARETVVLQLKKSALFPHARSAS